MVLDRTIPISSAVTEVRSINPPSVEIVDVICDIRAIAHASYAQPLTAIRITVRMGPF